MEAKQFVPGERIEALEIVGPSKNDKYGHRLWLCRCTLCGKETYVEGSKLRRGKSTSCGCDRKDKIAAKATPTTGPKEDLRGRIFGELEVLDAPPRKSDTNHWEWKCRCNACGTEKYFRAAKLRRGEVTSCGCQRGIKKFGADAKCEIETDAYDIIPKICFCDNLLDCAQYLIAFARAAAAETNKKAVLWRLYEDILNQSGVMEAEVFIRDKKWHITNGSMAVANYLFITMPKLTSPVKTLKNIEKYAQALLDNFSTTPRKPIDRNVVEEILHYLEEKYHFSDLVFGERIARFIILNVESKNENSAFVVLGNSTITVPGFLLYANHEDCQHIHPVEVFFHELGHAMHAAITGGIDVLPRHIMDMLDELCFPDITKAPLEDGREVLADVLGIGLMYNTPFTDHDSAHYMDIRVKKSFAELVDICLRNWDKVKQLENSAPQS